MLENTDSIIFDLDGTLWDSTAMVAKAWQAGIDQVDYVTDKLTQADIRATAGMPYSAIYDKLFPSLPKEKSEEFRKLCGKIELEYMNRYGGELYPGLEETLEYLQGKYRLFIVSNCQTGYIEAFLAYHNMQRFFTGHQCYGTKDQPKAENIKDIIADYELKQPVYIGDTMGDYEAARKAGVPFILADYGFGTVENGWEARLQSLADLKTIF
ncbi:HAD family hydrolase [Pontibacter sp. SGAir0037]|uniref:HAD family hydrolase n=1 Tax=Pontibacter sp. SGAir0037 TaxID=2571030 RepID=UPI0010CCD618|nr:HAD family hydrolase [Pontibacter sp. SGAir0037]QCR21552.1 HAD family hydrolase [Pontibacter sp. SGAir0037]